MALLDRIVDDVAISAADAMFTSMDVGVYTSDVLSIAPDAIALAASYQYNLTDLIVLGDSMFVETSFNTDTVEVSDAVLVTRTVGVNAIDAIGTSDSAVTGFVRWASPSDSVPMTDQASTATSYGRSVTDASEVSDAIHTWMAGDAILQASFEGSADLQAVLVKKKAPAVPVGAPPRVVMLPKPAPVLIEHNVVNPSPARRGEDR